jgi:hypothetical protein
LIDGRGSESAAIISKIWPIGTTLARHGVVPDAEALRVSEPRLRFKKRLDRTGGVDYDFK